MYREFDYKEKDKEWWNDQACSHLYYSLPWLSTLEKSFRFEPKILVDRDDQLLTVFCPVNDVRGSRIIILPFSDYTPACGMTKEGYNKILTYLQENYPESTIILKTTLQMEQDLKADKTTEALHYKISMEGPMKNAPSEEFMKGVKEAKDSGLRAMINNHRASLSNFYTLYHKTHFENLNSIPQPFTFFEHIWRTFIKTNKGNLIEVKDQNRVIAALIVLQHKDTLYYKFGCTAQKEFPSKGDNLLFHKLIHLADKLKCQTIDLGLCPTNEDHDCYRDWYHHLGANAYPVTYWTYTPEGTDAEKEEKVMKNLNKLTTAMIESNLNPQQTSAFSEKIYALYA